MTIAACDAKKRPICRSNANTDHQRVQTISHSQLVRSKIAASLSRLDSSIAPVPGPRAVGCDYRERSSRCKSAIFSRLFLWKRHNEGLE